MALLGQMLAYRFYLSCHEMSGVVNLCLLIVALIRLPPPVVRLQAAFRVHADMLQSGIHPDTRVFNALIHAAGQQQLHEEAKSFYCQLVAMGLHPTAHTFSLLFQAFCSGSHNQASWLLEVMPGPQ